MKIEYFTKPFDHFIITDLLSPKAASSCLAEAVSLESKFEPSGVLVQDSSAEFDDCDHCKQIKKVVSLSIRSNESMYFNNVFPDDIRWESIILNMLDAALFGKPFTDHITSKGGIWSLWKSVSTSDVQGSRYGKCDFYSWHQDQRPDNEEQRLFTIIYYLNEEPCTFKGGQLRIGPVDDFKQIEPKHNSCIIFPSEKNHCVENIHLCDPKFSAGRFSINYWAGFNNDCRIRKGVSRI